MKKSLFLTLMLLVAATATMVAQEELELTPSPVITCQSPSLPTFDTATIIIIENSEDTPDAEIYFSVYNSEWSYEPTDWSLYQEPIRFNEPGQYCIWAYAQALGMAASEIVACQFVVENEPTTIDYLYSFIVDGIYYMRYGENEVWVTTEGFANNIYYPLPQPISLCYSGDVVIPESVVYEGKTYSVTGIYHEAFMGCDITSLDLPATMAHIFEFNFSGTEDWSKVVCRAITPPEVEFGGNWDVSGQLPLFVPAESLEAYRAAEIWQEFNPIVPFLGAGPGDINGDGRLSITDVTGIIEQLLDGGDIPAYCDVNGDGRVSIGDVTTLINMLLSAQ